VERALDSSAVGGGGGKGGLRSAGVFVGRGLHEWRDARLIVGGWRADEKAPYQSSEERKAVVSGGGRDKGGAAPVAPAQACLLDLRGEHRARTWGMWFLEPESGGSVLGLAFAFSTPLPQATTYLFYYLLY
jgi:hypothetical protein